MATIKPEGIFACTIISARAGVINGKPLAQITVRIDEGPATGTRCTYEESLIGSGAKYARYSMNAVGWAGKTAQSLDADAAAWIVKTGGKSTVEIKHLAIKNGKNAGSTWDKVAAIGKGGAREMVPLPADLLADADQALREAAAIDGGAHDSSLDEDSPF